jgi:hypothetical protein
MIAGSVCRHLKIAGRFATGVLSAYQPAAPQSCNTTASRVRDGENARTHVNRPLRMSILPNDFAPQNHTQTDEAAADEDEGAGFWNAAGVRARRKRKGTRVPLPLPGTGAAGAATR